MINNFQDLPYFCVVLFETVHSQLAQVLEDETLL